MNKIYEHILSKASNGEKMLAILLDPEKCVGEILSATVAQLKQKVPDFIFIGGSSKSCNTDDLIDVFHEMNVPKVLFPGDAEQFTPHAEALLFLSLISGRNPDYLIGQHIHSAMKIKKTSVEVIPTGYILIDGGKESATKRLSQTDPIASDDKDVTIATAVAGELLGMKLIYLEAGSGAKNPVSQDIISSVKKNLTIPLIVGGGIKTTKQAQNALQAGADIIVIGNLFETHPEKISEFVEFVQSYQ